MNVTLLKSVDVSLLILVRIIVSCPALLQ